MIKYSRNPDEVADAGAAGAGDHIAPVPRISIQAFCEDAATASIMQAAGEDRRMGKAHVKIQMGGIAAAAEAYRNAPTPNVVIIESESRHDELLAGLDELAQVCDAGTRVIVVARANDITLYRELVRRGISDYLMAPIAILDVVRACDAAGIEFRGLHYYDGQISTPAMEERERLAHRGYDRLMDIVGGSVVMVGAPVLEDSLLG